MNRNDPSERVWIALKRLAQREAADLTQAEAVKRVKAIARNEGVLELPDMALRYYAQEYRDMVSQHKKSG